MDKSFQMTEVRRRIVNRNGQIATVTQEPAFLNMARPVAWEAAKDRDAGLDVSSCTLSDL